MSALPQDTDREAWLDWRRRGVGASDVAAILGISPWASPWSVWADKTGLLPPEPENEYMAAGRWLESAIGPWFEHETSLFVGGEQTWCSHDVHAHHRCTVDGFVHEGYVRLEDLPEGTVLDVEPVDGIDDMLGLLEVKVTGPGRRWDEPPAHYQAQGQWQMHVTDLERVWFAVLMGRRLDIHELARDQADIDLMVERVDGFWHDHVLAGVPPSTDGHDATLRALAAVYPIATPGTSLEADDGLRTEIAMWRNAKASKKDAERLEKQAAAAIQAALGDAEELTVDGQRAVSWRSQHRKPYSVAEADFRVLRSHEPKEK